MKAVPLFTRDACMRKLSTHHTLTYNMITSTCGCCRTLASMKIALKSLLRSRGRTKCCQIHPSAPALTSGRLAPSVQSCTDRPRIMIQSTRCFGATESALVPEAPLELPQLLIGMQHNVMQHRFRMLPVRLRLERRAG